MRTLTKGILGCLGTLLCAGSALAQNAGAAGAGASDTLEEIVVTAERREENLQKTPMNVSVISGEDIAQQGLSSLEQVLNGVPGVSVQGQVRGFVPSIRGLGTDLPPGSSQGSVATEVDGVYDIRAEAGRVGYYDLQRVEVLAGPQGTLYGVNSDGGVVNILSNNPVIGKYQSSAGLTVGNYNLLRGEGMLNLPVSANSSLRVSAAAINRDGYLTNTGADDNVGQGGRVKYLYQPSDNFSFLLGVEISKLGGVGAGSVPGYADGNSSPVSVNGKTYSSPWTDQSEGTTASDLNQWDRYDATKYWSNIQWNVGPGTLTFTPSYKIDKDLQNSCGMGSSCTIQGDPIKLEQNSEELRYSSLPGTALQWSGGLYHFSYSEAEAGMGPGNPPPVVYYQKSFGVFGETTYSFTDAMRLITGVRETHDEKHETDLPESGTWSHFDYRAGLEYDLTPQSMEYLTVATGYRPGGFNSDGSSFKTEVVRDIEVGSKNRFLNDRLQLNVDAYYYNFTNYQLLDFYFSGNCNALSPPPPTYNLSARNLGVDLGLSAAVTSSDTMSVQLAYADANFTSSQTISYNPPSSCPSGFNGDAIVDSYTINGSPEPRSPRLSGTASYEHRFTLGNGSSIAAKPAVHFAETQYVHPVENVYSHQPGFGTVDFSLLYTAPDGKWTLSGWGHNLGNIAIKTQLNPMILNEPRTYGVTLNASLN